MKRSLTILAMIVTLMTIIIAYPVSAATWYAGVYKDSIYGLEADIYTPSSAPYLGHDYGESSWVSTANYGDAWAQTGWYYNANDLDYAYAYTEYRTGGILYQDAWGIHPWGYYNNFRVERVSSYWYMEINDDIYAYTSGGDLPTPPCQMQAFSEVHESSSTVLDTTFRNVSSKNSGGTWSLVTIGTPYYNSPYQISITNNYYNYRTYGP